MITKKEGNPNVHIFALYYPQFHKTKGNLIVIEDKDIIHRITKILRLSQGSLLIFFDRVMHGEVSIASLTSKVLVCDISFKRKNSIWSCSLTFFLPLLKREALAVAVYALVEAGVQEIQLVYTDKVQRSFGGSKEMDRLERICVAAAEQSKNFAFPVIKEPIAFQDILPVLHHTVSYVGKPSGIPFFKVLSACEVQLAGSYSLLTGPEGDFSPQEWKMLAQTAVIGLQLTPTILRAETAAFYLAALFRSFSSAH